MAIDRRRGSTYLPLREAMDQLFEGSFIGPNFLGTGAGFPHVDIHSTDEDVVVEMAVPGADPDDINISVTGDTVTVSGEVRREQQGQKGQALVEEIWKGQFQRSFQLPLQVDSNRAEASYDNGILRLTLPKSEATKPRKIQVRSQQPTIEQGRTQQSQTTQTETVPVNRGE